MKRIQRKRTKGWRMPLTALYVGRPTKFGNPFAWRDYINDWDNDEKSARGNAVMLYRDWLAGKINQWTLHRDWILSHLDDLRGFDLACFCPLDHACHADVLIEMVKAKEK